MSRLTRDGTAEPVSRDQILRHARGQGNIIFPVQLTTSRIGNLTRLIHTLLYVMTIHTYIHTAESPPAQGRKPQGRSERVLPWQITMDQLIFASLSHTHYWYEVGVLKVPAVNETSRFFFLLLPPSKGRNVSKRWLGGNIECWPPKDQTSSWGLNIKRVPRWK